MRDVFAAAPGEVNSLNRRPPPPLNGGFPTKVANTRLADAAESLGVSPWTRSRRVAAAKINRGAAGSWWPQATKLTRGAPEPSPGRRTSRVKAVTQRDGGQIAQPGQIHASRAGQFLPADGGRSKEATVYCPLQWNWLQVCKASKVLQ